MYVYTFFSSSIYSPIFYEKNEILNRSNSFFFFFFFLVPSIRSIVFACLNRPYENFYVLSALLPFTFETILHQRD